jgi:hypothetical protein
VYLENDFSKPVNFMNKENVHSKTRLTKFVTVCEPEIFVLDAPIDVIARMG